MKLKSLFFIPLFFLFSIVLVGQKKEFTKAVKDGYNERFEYFAFFRKPYTKQQITDYCQKRGYRITDMKYEENFIYGKSQICVSRIRFTSSVSLAAKEKKLTEQRALAAQRRAARRKSGANTQDATAVGMVIIGAGLIVKAGFEIFSSAASSGGSSGSSSSSSSGYSPSPSNSTPSTPCAKVLSQDELQECGTKTQSVRISCRDTDNITIYYWGPEFEKACDLQLAGNTNQNGFYLKKSLEYDKFLHTDLKEAIKIGCKCN